MSDLINRSDLMKKFSDYCQEESCLKCTFMSKERCNIYKTIYGMPSDFAGIKTKKYNRMIEEFEIDFNLAEQGDITLAELDAGIKAGNPNLLYHISLLKELSYLLRHGKAEIYLMEGGLNEYRSCD